MYTIVKKNMNAQKKNEHSKDIIACPSEFTQKCIQKTKICVQVSWPYKPAYYSVTSQKSKYVPITPLYGFNSLREVLL